MPTDHELKIDDTQSVEENAAGKPVDDGRADYIVTAAGGIFKNGRLYAEGETIRLEIETASRFMKLKEVKEAN